MIFAFAGGAAGGGGGGRLPPELDTDDELRVCDGIDTGAGIGRGAGLGAARGVAAAAEDEPPLGRGWGFLPAVTLDGRPLGPPGLMSLPRVMGLGGTGLPLGIGLDAELEGSPGWVWTAPLL